MGAITTKTTTRFLREDNPSFWFGSDLLARGSDVRKDCSTEEIISSIGTIDSFLIIDGVIEELSIDIVSSLIFDPSLVEANSVGVVIEWRINAKG